MAMHTILAILIALIAFFPLSTSGSTHIDTMFSTCIADPTCVSMFCQLPTPSQKAFEYIVGPTHSPSSDNNTIQQLYAIASVNAPRCAIGQRCEWDSQDMLIRCVGTARSGGLRASSVMLFITGLITVMAAWPVLYYLFNKIVRGRSQQL